MSDDQKSYDQESYDQESYDQELYESTRLYSQLAEQWRDEEVPPWNRARPLVQPQRRPAALWLNWTAVAASVLALALSLARVEISTHDGWSISVGSRHEADIQQIVTTALTNATALQNARLDTRFVQFAASQQEANRLLFTAWQDSSRQERRQELGLLLSGWQSQRYQDQQNIAARFTELTNDQLESNRYLNTMMQTVAQPGRRSL